jgi:hypothetical protein
MTRFIVNVKIKCKLIGKSFVFKIIKYILIDYCGCKIRTVRIIRFFPGGGVWGHVSSQS